MDWQQAQEIRETHRKMGAHNQPYRCSACSQEWPCRVVSDAVETMRQAAPIPAYGDALRFNDASR